MLAQQIFILFLGWIILQVQTLNIFVVRDEKKMQQMPKKTVESALWKWTWESRTWGNVVYLFVVVAADDVEKKYNKIGVHRKYVVCVYMKKTVDVAKTLVILVNVHVIAYFFSLKKFTMDTN